MKTMSLDRLFELLELGQHQSAWQTNRQLAQSAERPDVSEWPADTTISQACRQLKMSEEIRKACLDTTAWIRSSPALLEFVWLCHYTLFIADPEKAAKISAWPMLPDSFGQPAAMFYAVVLLSGYPTILKKHQARSIPHEITVDALRDLELWIHEYRNRHQAWGFKEMGWLVNHFTGRLFQLGRLQYEMTTLTFPFRFYKHRYKRELAIFAEEGLQFRLDGQFEGADGVSDPERAWTARLQEDLPQIEGCPVSRRGGMLNNPIRLDKRDWELVLKSGDPVLFVHIPAQGQFHGPMSHEACEESFQRASNFFPKYFSDYPFKGYICGSWFLDGQLADYLAAESNIVRFQKRFHLMPLKWATDHQTMERVFGGKVDDWSNAPRNTSLQRIIIDHVLAGKRWREGAGVCLRQEVEMKTRFDRMESVNA